MVQITREMTAAAKAAFREWEERTDRAILAAVKQGKNRAIFPLDHTDAEFSMMREYYERNGYRIAPVGIIGGVRQRDYYIMW